MNAFSRVLNASALLAVLSLAAIAQPSRTGYADIEDRKVYYEMKGQGPAIVLLHGFSLDCRMWDPQFDALAQSYCVLRYDLSGYGRSSVPDSSVSGSHELAALLRFVGITRAALVGMSMGGNVAINFTLEHPEMVDALITVASTLDGYSFREPTRSWMRRVVTVAKDSGLAKAKELWLTEPFLTPVRQIAPIRAKIRQMISDWSGAQFMRGTFADFLPLSPPAIKRLDQIKVPTLALNGEQDDPNMRAIADTIAAQVPGAKRLVIPGSGHLVSLEQPEKFTRVILDFISGSPRR